VHFRALVVDEKSGTKEAAEDANLFVGDSRQQEVKKTGGGEIGESDTDDGHKKARYVGGGGRRRGGRGGSHHRHHHRGGGGGSSSSGGSGKAESSDDGVTTQMVGEAKECGGSDDGGGGGGAMMEVVVAPQSISACSSGNMADFEEWNELDEDADDEFWQAVWTQDAIVAEQAALQTTTTTINADTNAIVTI